MALATRCPHCLTTFRVANDQLKLHAGLVRCGSCRQTFNGIENLLAPTETAPPAAPAAPEAPLGEAGASSPATELPATPETQAAAVAPPAPAADSAPEAVPSSASLEFDLGQENVDAMAPDIADDIVAGRVELETREALLDETSTEWSQADDGGAPTPEADPEPAAEPAHEFSGIPTSPTSPISETPAETASEAGRLQEPYLAETDSDAAASGAVDGEPSLSEAEPAVLSLAEDDIPPDFVLQAEKGRRRSRVQRFAMLGLSAILLPALLAQSAYSLRSQIAAWLPATRPFLSQACQVLRCQLSLPAQIEQITIESSELQALAPDRNVFVLMLQLQNRSGTLQAWPILELVLNDARDRAVLQRAFTPAEYLAVKADAAKGFAAGSEQNIKLYFELPKLKAAGYHVNVFYP